MKVLKGVQLLGLVALAGLIFSSCAVAGLADPGARGSAPDPVSGCAVAGLAPTLYSNGKYEGPVRGGPGDVLLLAGVGFEPGAVVVYQAVDDTTLPVPTPSALPTEQSWRVGSIVPVARDANGIKVQLPSVVSVDQSYSLWVVNRSGGATHFSNVVLINDARPMWLSPGRSGAAAPLTPYVFETAGKEGLGREIKIAGENLQPAPRAQTQVRFRNTTTGAAYTRAAERDGVSSRYAARVILPAAALPQGEYEILLSRDGKSWVSLGLAPSNRLTVLPDPVGTVATFDVRDYAGADLSGGWSACRGDDGEDDTLCITRAIEAARREILNRGMSGLEVGAHVAVGFPSGTWLVNRSCWQPHVDGGSWNTPPITDHLPGDPDGSTYTPCGPLSASPSGILVPAGVSLESVAAPGSTPPSIQTGESFVKPFLDLHLNTDWGTTNRQERQVLFKLQGNNLVKGLRFHDDYTYTLPLPPPWSESISMPTSMSLGLAGDDITITGNYFDGTYRVLHTMGKQLYADGWTPPASDRLGTAALLGYKNIVLTGNQVATFEGVDFWPLMDSVITGNTFWPGKAPHVMAVNIRGSLRLDISLNSIDGTVKTHSGTEAGKMGFRAGIFLPSLTGQENLLVTRNTIKCVGTRAGQDGEAIVTDANLARVGFKSGKDVIRATATTVTVSTTDRDLADADFPGRWVRIDAGPGLGQTRKVVQAVTAGAEITFTVTPAFDVMPVAGSGQSRILVSPQAWHLHIVDNTVDNAETTCNMGLSSLNSSSLGGLIALSSATASSSIEGNHLRNTGGLYVSAQYYNNYFYGSDCSGGYCTKSSNLPCGSTACHVSEVCVTADGGPPSPSNPGVCKVPCTLATEDQKCSPKTLWRYEWGPYFVDLRGNVIDGTFGSVAGGINPCNTYGSGIGIEGVVISLVPDATNDHEIASNVRDTMGFGLSVSHNSIRNAALLHRYERNNSHGPVLALGWSFLFGEQSMSPAFVGMSVFGNSITDIPPAPSSTPGCDLWAGKTTIAITNGEARTSPAPLRAPNYPRGTTICEEEPHADFPPSGTLSTLTVCPALPWCGGIMGILCPTGQVCVDDPSDDCVPGKGSDDCNEICLGIPADDTSM